MKLWKIKFLPSRISNIITIARKNISIGKNVQIYGRLKAFGKGKISIGNDCLLNSAISADPIGGDSNIILRADYGGEIRIGNNCGLSNCTIVAQTRVTIGNEVYIGGGCKIYDTDFHPIDRLYRINEMNEYTNRKPITIKDGAFVGAHSIILKGVCIGENSVIGAGSVVTKNVPANEIWAGNPARKIKEVKNENIMAN